MGGDLLADYRRKNIGFWNHFGMIFGIKKHHRIFLWHKNPTQSYFINLILLLANEFLLSLEFRGGILENNSMIRYTVLNCIICDRGRTNG